MRWIALLLLLANGGLLAWTLAGGGGEPEREVRLPDEVGELVLLREPTADTNAHVCYTIGPFDDAEEASRAAEVLAGMGIESDERILTDEEVYGYQVYLPPFPSRDEARETVTELAEQGVRDYFIVAEPDLRNAVSLGMFSEQRYAVRHLRYLESLGFDPEMRLRTRERERFWRDYRDPAGEVDGEILAALATDQSLQRLARDCD